MSIGDWLGVVGVLIGVVAIIFGFLTFTNETVRSWYLRKLRKNIPKRFEVEANKYVASDAEEDLKRRIWKKNRYADRLTWYAMGLDLDRAMLANSSANEGFSVALCGMVAVGPKADDFKHVMKCASFYAPPHAKYRLIDAVRALGRSKDLPADGRSQLIGIMASWSKDQDHEEDLRRRAKDTEALLRSGA